MDHRSEGGVNLQPLVNNISSLFRQHILPIAAIRRRNEVLIAFLDSPSADTKVRVVREGTSRTVDEEGRCGGWKEYAMTRTHRWQLIEIRQVIV